jgi:glutaredoxin 2
MNTYFKHGLPQFRTPDARALSKQITQSFNEMTQLVQNSAEMSRELTLCIRQLELAHFYAQKAIVKLKESK